MKGDAPTAESTLNWSRSLKTHDNIMSASHLHFHPEDFQSYIARSRPLQQATISVLDQKKKHNVLAAASQAAAQQGNASQIFHTNDSFPSSQTHKATSTSLILRIESQNTTKDRSDCDLKTTLVTTSGPI